MDPVTPDYDGATVTGVVPALLGQLSVPWLPRTAAEAEATVLLVLDGLGWNAVEAHRSLLPELGAMEGRAIATVVPSTTSAALTSITTGLAPSQHGIVGFRMRVEDAVLNVLRWRADGWEAPDPFSVQRHTAFLGRPVPVVTKSEFRDGGFTRAHLRGSRFVGWSTCATLVEHCRRLVDEGERLVYSYYPGVDSVAHEYGLHDGFFEAELAAVDRLVGRMLDALPGRAALVVTADHGQVHFGREGWVGLDALDGLVGAYAGDGRFRYLHARSGAASELLAAATEEVGHQAWVLGREQLLDEGWLGPGPVAPGVRRRVGDVVLAAREPVAFVDPTFRKESQLLAGHGSVTPDEMLVPLLAAPGRR
ncbi:MAG: alkaline phosphatase family protein [Acidimicrobiia bacterium]|nr:alkaline phosphatase family protein [Acidimicrobiia bacterium]